MPPCAEPPPLASFALFPCEFRSREEVRLRAVRELPPPPPPPELDGSGEATGVEVEVEEAAALFLWRRREKKPPPDAFLPLEW